MTRAAPPFVATGSQTVGPFFHVGPAATDRLGRMAAPGTPGEHIRLRIGVFDADGQPVNDALIELWQADAAGVYGAPAPPSDESAFSGFGRLGTGEDGWCTFDTIRPGPIGGEPGSRQAAHINVCLFARGLLRHLYTRIYFDADPAIAEDPLLSLVSADRRATLVAAPGAEPSTWVFRVRLQGDAETVFFDL